MARSRRRDKDKKKKNKKNKKKKKLTARTADKHLLYQEAVQDPQQEIRFVSRVFRRITGRRARALREDFCGTAFSSAAWVRSASDRVATGVDLDGGVLAWGREHNVEPLGDAAERLTLLRQDVRTVSRAKFDVCVAMNFSYFVFKERSELVRYFRAVQRSLVRDGVFFLDIYGGFEAQQTLVDDRRVGKFTYLWDQAKYNPLDGRVVNHIHFEFPDGSRIDRAFTYDWRLWQPAEVREALLDAGFANVELYWENEDEDGEGDGTFRRRKVVENMPGWLAFIVAAK